VLPQVCEILFKYAEHFANILSDSQTTPAPARRFANAFLNLSVTPLSPRSCETMPPLSVAWLSFYWLFPIRLSPP
jgi:hypothetical protein